MTNGMSFLEFRALAAKELDLSALVDGVQYDSVMVERVLPVINLDDALSEDCAVCNSFGRACCRAHRGNR